MEARNALLLVFFVLGSAGWGNSACQPDEAYDVQLGQCISCRICEHYPKQAVCQNCTHDLRLPEQRLHEDLFSNYNKHVRPVWNISKPIIVSLTMSITQILSLNERDQVLTTNVWIEQHWFDDKMRWNPADYNGIEVMRILADELWVPDITLYDTADEKGYALSRDSNALVGCNGTVDHWSKPTLLKSTCKITVRFFPFDTQICQMKFSSWTYTSLQLDLFNHSLSPDLSNFIKNEQWDIINSATVRNVVSYDCCPENYPDVTFYLQIRRKPLYYLYNVILPCVLLTGLSVLGFMMPFSVGVVKVSNGVMLLLSLGVFNLQVSQTMPKTSEEVPILSDYFALTMSMIAFSIALNVAVLNINDLGKKEGFEVPYWIRKIFLEYLGSIFCINCCNNRQCDKDENDDGQSNVVNASPRKRLPLENGSTYGDMSQIFAKYGVQTEVNQDGTTMVSVASSPPQSPTKYGNLNPPHSRFFTRQENTPNSPSYSSTFARNYSPYHSDKKTALPPRTFQHVQMDYMSSPEHSACTHCEKNSKEKAEELKKLKSSVDQIVTIMKEPVAKIRRKERIASEWAMVATVVDRFLVFAFVCIVVVMSISLLTKRPNEDFTF